MLNSNSWGSSFYLRSISSPIDRGMEIPPNVRSPGCGTRPCAACRDIVDREILINTGSGTGYRANMDDKGLRPHSYWLDLSQRKLNPWIRFRVLRSRQWRIENGRLDVRLAAYNHVYAPQVGSTDALWRKTFVTQPACQTLSLCFADPRGVLHLLTTLHDPDGIQAGPLLDAMKLCVPRVVEKWIAFQRETQNIDFSSVNDLWNLEELYQWQ